MVSEANRSREFRRCRLARDYRVRRLARDFAPPRSRSRRQRPLDHSGTIDSHAHVARWALRRHPRGVVRRRARHARSASSSRRQEAHLGRCIYCAGAMIDGVPPTYSDARAAVSPSSARKKVDRLVSDGVDLIKVYTRVDPKAAPVDHRRSQYLQSAGHGASGFTDAVTASNAASAHPASSSRAGPRSSGGGRCSIPAPSTAWRPSRQGVSISSRRSCSTIPSAVSTIRRCCRTRCSALFSRRVRSSL